MTDKKMPEWNDTNIQKALIMTGGTPDQQVEAREFLSHYLLPDPDRFKPYMNLYLLNKTNHAMCKFNRMVVAAPNEEVARTIRPTHRDDDDNSDSYFNKNNDPTRFTDEDLLSRGFGEHDYWDCTLIGKGVGKEPKLILSHYWHP